MLDYMRLVLRSSNKEAFDYLIKWLVNVVKGKKNLTCVYAISAAEGAGKSTFTDFCMEYKLGSSRCCKDKSDQLKGQQSTQISSKIFVIFEELQVFID